MGASKQTEKLAKYIQKEFHHEIVDGGAGDVAIIIMDKLREENRNKNNVTKTESLNYTDTCILIRALTDYINQDKRPGGYAIELLLKLERNKGELYDTTNENDAPTTGA